ncbi:hypothetical protein M426DRAFT_13376 [Hypoxylon sp. CI-4A]|nr:hypothetical protein M426DRAFT_13376 [Hypoxylon sp. CI-4A]
MKGLRGLRWALESTRSRYAPFHTTSRAQLSFSPSTGFPSKPAQHVLSQPMRAVMRQLPHPVVVITTLENICSLSEFEDVLDDQLARPIPRAMTVSSFTSLSINPVPRVTFNITLPSTTYQALAKCGRFNAHVLTGDDHGAKIADLFTRGNRPSTTKGTPEDIDQSDLGVLAGLESLGVEILEREKWQQEWEQARDYRRKMLSTNKSGAPKADRELPPSGTLPVLQGKGVLHVLKCEYRHLEPPVDGDFDHHAIVMGEVLDIIPGESKDDDSIALAYADRAYRQMGEKLLERPATHQTDTQGTVISTNNPNVGKQN